MTEKKNKPQEINAWMFRKEGEILTLLITLAVVTSILLYLASFNLWVAIGVILMSIIYIKLQQASLLADSIRVSKQQFPNIYTKLVEYAKKLNTPYVNLYIKQDPVPNAYTFGFRPASIVLNSSLIENLSEDELNFIIAHELGHIKAGHNIVNTLISPVGGTFLSYWNMLFSFWQRKAELTSDRCALILTKDLDSAIKVLTKLGGGMKLPTPINWEAYSIQLKKADNFLVNLSEITQSHPFVSNRIKELIYFKKDQFISIQNRK